MVATLSEVAYEHIRRRITRGELPAGSRLVNRVLAKEIGISFTPVREAIHRLSSEGFVEYRHGAGAFVRQADRKELEQMYDLRESLEPFAAAEAARNITPDEIDELQRVCDDWLSIVREIRDRDQSTATPEQMNRWLDNEERFHTLLIRAAGNRWLTRVMCDLGFISHSFQQQRREEGLLTVSIASRTWREHVVLVRNLRDGDADRCRDWMAQHIKSARAFVLSYFQRMTRTD